MKKNPGRRELRRQMKPENHKPRRKKKQKKYGMSA